MVEVYAYLLFKVAVLEHIFMVNSRSNTDFDVSVPNKLHRNVSYLQLE
jgi:hypothetical protein